MILKKSAHHFDHNPPTLPPKYITLQLGHLALAGLGLSLDSEERKNAPHEDGFARNETYD